MKKVRMRHPELGVAMDFPASAVPHHGAAGWERVPEEEVQAEIKAAQEQKKKPTKTPRRRPNEESQ